MHSQFGGGLDGFIFKASKCTKKEMKSVVKLALELDLHLLCIKEGYNGAPILEIATRNAEHAAKIKTFMVPHAESVRIIQKDGTIHIFGVFGQILLIIQFTI